MVNPSLPGAAFGYGSTKKPEQTKSFVSKPSQNLSVFEPIPMSTSGNITKDFCITTERQVCSYSRTDENVCCSKC